MRAFVFAFLLVAACDDSNAVKENVARDAGATPDASDRDSGDADGGDAGPTDCVMNPKTHAEIINACTTATKITKNPVLPKLLPDGGLPPLQ